MWSKFDRRRRSLDVSIDSFEEFPRPVTRHEVKKGRYDARTYSSECTQCPASSSSNTTPGNMSCIMGKLCLLTYL
jgi:hypothetical protein